MDGRGAGNAIKHSKFVDAIVCVCVPLLSPQKKKQETKPFKLCGDFVGILCKKDFELEWRWFKGIFVFVHSKTLGCRSFTPKLFNEIVPE